MAASSVEKRDANKTQEQVDIGPAVNASLTSQPEPELEYVPDGGKEAWTVVLGSSLALFASAGMINAYVSMALFLPPVMGQ